MITRSLGAILFMVAGTTLAAAWSIEPSDPGPFYAMDRQEISATPGDILRIEDFPSAPQGARAWRVLYASTGLKDEPIAVSGVIVAPEGAAPAGGRPVVAWAHGTTGVTSRCAPSLRSDFFKHVPAVQQFLERGYVVAASDYPGLGTPSPHPYLVGVSEARAVLDSVRAAAHVEGVGASSEFAVWGHSQGGHAALFTGQLAASYAPDLKLVGVAAAAPASDLAALLHDDLSSRAGKIFTGLAIWSWNKVFEAPLAPLLDPPAIAALDRIAADCMEGSIQGLVLLERETSIEDDFLKQDLTEVEPWKTILVENMPDSGNLGGPLFIAQGTADPIVLPRVTRAFAEAACRSGTPVRLHPGPGLDHMGILNESGAAVDWIVDRFAGLPPPSDCGDLPSLTASPG
ncbi:alpha/beta fold hydrolase [Chelativorans sp.]|uniref:alpha/beta fold hydrolase n=1 Tax=Chelativorans sp. TaxID=2203393 RepID=UPI0028128BA7|nr:alpha/beta fold hydrolase [Chelativorans sp.]